MLKSHFLFWNILTDDLGYFVRKEKILTLILEVLMEWRILAYLRQALICFLVYNWMIIHAYCVNRNINLAEVHLWLSKLRVTLDSNTFEAYLSYKYAIYMLFQSDHFLRYVILAIVVYFLSSTWYNFIYCQIKGLSDCILAEQSLIGKSVNVGIRCVSLISRICS